MKRRWTIIGVADVTASSAWCYALLGLPTIAPAHSHFGQIADADGTVLLCLHAWAAHEHPSLTSPKRAEPRNGLLPFFRVDDFAMALSRVRVIAERLEEESTAEPEHGNDGVLPP